MKVALGSWCGVESGDYDGGGVQWGVKDVTGWFDGPPMRTNFTSRPHHRGQFDAPTYADGRVITVEGRIGVDSTTDLPALAMARRATQALLADGSTGMLTIDEAGESLQAEVRASDKATCDPAGPLAFDFSVQLTAPDPVRYSTAESEAGAQLAGGGSAGLVFPLVFPLRFGAPDTVGVLYLVNDGTADVLPTFTITGPLNLATLTAGESGARLEYNAALGAGQKLVIDCQSKRVTLQGVSRLNSMGRIEFDGFAVPAGGVLKVFFGSRDVPVQGARVDATYREGWW